MTDGHDLPPDNDPAAGHDPTGHDPTDGDLAPVHDLTDQHDRFRIDLGGYVLGNLTLDEQQALEVHLEGCEACRAELGELEGLPILLELARPEAASPRSARPEAGGPEPIHRAPEVVGSRRRSRVLVGAGAVLAIAAALIIGVLIGRPDQPAFGRSIPLQTAAAAPVPSAAGEAAFRATDNGTVVRLDLEGLPAEGSWYECTWSSGQGDQSAGTFRPAADGSVHIDLTTAARLYPGWTLTIVEHPGGAADGRAVLEASA